MITHRTTLISMKAVPLKKNLALRATKAFEEEASRRKLNFRKLEKPLQGVSLDENSLIDR